MPSIPATSARNEAFQNRLEFKVWKPLLAFVLFVIAITVAGYLVFEHRKDELKVSEQHDLGGMAKLKIGQITNWIAERKGDAYALSNDPLFLDEVERWLQQGSPSGKTKARLIERLALYQHPYQNYDYVSISLLDGHARPRLSTAANPAPIGEYLDELVQGSMRSGQIVFSDIRREKQGMADVLSINVVAPLFAGKGKQAHAIGAVIFRIDPDTFLFPLIRNWPTSSPSAENMLIRRDGDEVIFLNELRHLKNTPLVMRSSLGRQQLLATQAVTGHEGLAEGVDYRGVPVVGILSKVPGTPWFLISKIDQAEIEAPINRMAKWMTVLMLALIVTGGALTVFWRNREVAKYQRELNHQMLAMRMDYLAKYANDIILLMDSTGKIIDFNDRAVEAYGYSAEEFSGINMAMLRAIEFTPPFAEYLHDIDLAGALRLESTHVRKSGETFPVECSVRRIDTAGGKLYQTIVRDITARKKLEMDIVKAGKKFHLLFDAIPDSIFIADMNGHFIQVNRSGCEHLGYSHEEFLQMGPADIVTPEYAANMRERFKQLQERGQLIFESAHVSKSGAVIPVELSAQIVDYEGQPAVMALARDITARKRSESQLHELTMHLQVVREEERTRIARELHDELGQSMTALRFDLRWLDTNVDPQEMHAHEKLHSMNELIGKTVDAIRRISEDLRPGMLDDLGLAAAIENHVEKFTGQTGIVCDLSMSQADFDLDTQVATNLFRLVQEALTNVARHSGASRVIIRLQEIEDKILLIVQDNGRGLPPAGTVRKKSFGLLGMRERVAMLGGTLDVFNEKGAGARIEACVPKHVTQQGERV